MEDQSNEKWIIQQVLNGDPEAFAGLVDKYKSALYGLLLGMGASHQDAQDLAQETFIKAYRKLRDHREQSSFASWLYTIAINLFRSQKRRRTFGFVEQSLLQKKEDALNPEEQYMRKEAQLDMQQKLAKLPERYRIVLLLRYTNELSYEEIAAVTGLTIHQVKNRLHRARLKLRKQWSHSKEDSHETIGLRQTP
ncbi:RNA polymerase sigma factor [Paenibacillus donghaensis]|uniref:RNA polymerase sigma factor n=1 Tax=Paenibacillus donghaensis TaxID=414771 RepID=A0A2Z2K560_9BACL|nr:sigma-70 family RNA polymerase sigma factor [Paenibacillus donghaensis]ASA21176.1 hypothetical protein B9T62_10480 [Paenibacillus donghaensis]